MPPRIPKNYFAVNRENNAYLPSEFEQTYDKFRTSRNVQDTRKTSAMDLLGDRTGREIGYDYTEREYERQQREKNGGFSPSDTGTISEKDRKALEELSRNYSELKSPYSSSSSPRYNHEEALRDIGSSYDESLREMSYKVPRK